MGRIQFLLVTFLILLTGCSGNGPPTVPGIEPDPILAQSGDPKIGGYIPWGFYDFEIARDGSSAEVIPNRRANVFIGYHMNVVKLLENGPCTNCLWLSNLHVLPNGDVSVDVSIRHPYMDRRYTGFDVRGIIMLPASQCYPDNEIREILGLEPKDWRLRWASHKKGDAELMNPDGWTDCFSPVEVMGWHYRWDTNGLPEEYKELPIFQYYPGKLASGENLSTLSAFKRFYSNETRHMFEVGQTVTRTYIIRPPETGNILASYSVYAHWSPAETIPVVNPETDFPPEANSPSPYEYTITQDSPLDIDDPEQGGQSDKIHWRIKTWNYDLSSYLGSINDTINTGGAGGNIYLHPSEEPDDYWIGSVDYFGGWFAVPDMFPGTGTILCRFRVRDPNDWYNEIAQDTWIMEVEYAAQDGEW